MTEMGLGQNLLDTPTLRSGAYVRPRGAWVANTAYLVDDQVTADNAVWNCTTAHTSGATFTGTDWELAAPVSLTQTITTSQDVTAPVWATIAKTTLIGGGGGAEAGAVATSTATANGGAGGGGGAVETHTIPVAGGTTYPVVIGAGGNGIAHGAGGGGGGLTTFAGLTAFGGGAGSGIGGGYGTAYSGAYYNTNTGLQGTYGTFLGNGGSQNCPMVLGGFEGVWGGQCGGNTAAAATTGAGGGQAVVAAFGTQTSNLVQTAASATANGVNGMTATSYGSGGGGGGAAGVGGTPGTGGNGAPGVCIIEWRSQ